MWAIVESLRLGVGDFGCGGSGVKSFGMSDMVSDLGIFGMGVAPGRLDVAEVVFKKLDVAEAPVWTLEVVDFM